MDFDVTFANSNMINVVNYSKAKSTPWMSTFIYSPTQWKEKIALRNGKKKETFGIF